MSALLELAERCEAATAEQQRELLEDAWAAIHGRAPRRNRGGDNAVNRFVSMIDAKAYESAAMTLVPEGLHFGLGDFYDIKCAWAWCGRMSGTLAIDEEIGSAATTALALCAAAMRALARMAGDER
jgi:hypothetical protein